MHFDKYKGICHSLTALPSNINDLSILEYALDNKWDTSDIAAIINLKPSISSKMNSSNLILKYLRNNEILEQIMPLCRTEDLTMDFNKKGNPVIFEILRSNKKSLIIKCLAICDTIAMTNKYNQNILSFYLKYGSYISKEVLTLLVDSIKKEVGSEAFFDYINYRDNFGKTPFSIMTEKAIRQTDKKRKEKILRFMPYMVNEGANVNLHDKSRITPILWSCIDNDTLTFQKLLSLGANLELESLDGDSCMLHSLLKDNDVIKDACLNNIPKFKKRERFIGKHPIFESLVGGSEYDSLSIISKMEDSVNLSNPDGDDHTLLIYAVKSGSIELCKRLIEFGADVNLCNKHHISPLMYAIYNFNNEPESYTQIIRLLIDNNADIEHMNLNGDNVIDLAKSRSLGQQVGTLFFHKNLKKIADHFFEGDREEAKKSALAMGDNTLGRLYEEDIDNLNVSELIEEKLKYEKEKERLELNAKIKEGRHLIAKNIAANIPILIGVTALSEQFLKDYNNNYVVASIAATCSVTNFLLSFSSEDKHKMRLSLDDSIKKIDQNILEPVREINTKIYLKLSFINKDLVDAIDMKWRSIKNALIKLKNYLSPKAKDDISEVQISRVISEYEKFKDSNLDVDSDLLRKILKNERDLDDYLVFKRCNDKGVKSRGLEM